MKKRWSLSAIPQSSGSDRASMTAGVSSPKAPAASRTSLSVSASQAVRADVRLNGKVLKKNGGFLRQWRLRPMVVTADGFLRYEKKKGDSTRTKETDLLKAEISGNLSLQGNYYCIEIQSGQKQFSLGFASKSEARLWQEVMNEVADANAGGRRLWVAQLRRVLTLNLRDRRDAVEAMGNRDWLTEWNFCWKSLKNRQDEDFNGRRRRLKRLYTIWLQFHVFAEIVAEIHFATVQSRDLNRNPSSRDTSFRKSESDVSDSRSDSSSLLPSTGWAVTWSNSPVINDIDTVNVKAMKLEYGSKTWGGEKRLKKEVADLARFRLALEDLTSSRGMHDAMSKFPVFPLMAAFSIRGIQVVASALPLSNDIEVVKVDRRDLAEVSGGLRVHGDLGQFAFGEFPDIWVRRVKGAQDGEIVRVSSKYDDVLRQSLRSSMVHGVLLRAGKDSIEVLSAHDINELVQGISPRWTPYLNLFYYQLESSEAPLNNHPARQFLLKRPKSLSCHGDIVIAIEPNRSRLQLNLKEAFIQKYQIELLPVVRRLHEVRSTSAHMMNGAFALKSAEALMSDPAAAIADELEATIKYLLRRHIQDVAKKLVTMGDDVSLSASDPHDKVDRSTFSSSTPRHSFQTDYRPRQSSVDAFPSAAQRGRQAAGSIYIIDAIHLRKTLKRQGVNTNMFPLVFGHVSELRQPGIQILLASDIISRIAKTLFQFRLSHDQNAEKSLWRSRKSRLIEFITQIMVGLHEEEGASQFWDVDAPIWFLLGPYASSIALGDYRVIKPEMTIQTYRQTLRINPAVLFNSLLQSFGAHLADGYLPALDETRWTSLQFLRREGQLNFFDEAIDPKLAIAYDFGWLSATMQSFRLNFEHLQRLFVDRGGSITAKSEIQSAKVFFAALASQFRHSVASTSETRVESAIVAMDIQQTACQAVIEAHVALQEYRLDDARDLARQACDAISASGAQLSFPLELKIYLVAIFALSDRETGPLSPTKKGTSALAKRWSVALSWLHHFYRAANNSSLLPSMCPHPLAEAIRLMAGSSRSTDQPSMPYSPEAVSLRLNTERGARFDIWEALSPIVERQFHLTGPSSVTRVKTTVSAVPEAPLTRANSDMIQRDSFPAADSMRRSSSDPLRMLDNSNGNAQAMDLAGPHPNSSWDRVLRSLEQLLLPVINDAKGCWMIPGYLFDSTATQNSRFPPSVMSEHVPVPGMAFMWGRSNGLSLDDESKLSSTKIDGIRCRPSNQHDIRVLDLPLPTRRVLQVSCGYRHTALITAGDQILYTFGYGECGRLGHGDEQSIEEPKRVEFLYDLARNIGGSGVAGASHVSCGREHTMVVLANGELFGFGWAEAGRLGTGESGSVVNPSRVVALKDAAEVACGREHTLVLTKSGNVYSFGAGFGGRLGNGGEDDEELPVLVAGLSGERIIHVDAGECHSSALTQNGEVYTWGFGSSGALGTGSRDNAYTPVKVEGPWTDSREGERVVGVACGSYHTLAYTTHGRLYGWGDSAAGQLGEKLVDAEDMVVLKPHQLKLPRSPAFQGENNSLQRIRAIACGTFTSAMSTLDGKLFVWGSAAAGNGAALDREDAKLKQIGVLSEFPIDQIACGAYHCVALSSTPVWT